MSFIKITVGGMTCEHCKSAVEKALGELAGISSVKVDLAAKQAVIEYDEQVVKPAAIKQAVEDLGYDVTGI
ncbi:MAG TPA: copper resistance protein CopZ [Firmicutes bacterium]|nr:copper resistance protein CopZ [Bacillota bacterium]HWR56531.1 copper ion binding protein [Negativicutes bacterium]